MVLAVAAILFSMLLRPVDSDHPFGFGIDSGEYWDLAGNLLEGRGFVDKGSGGWLYYSSPDFVPHVVRLPVYPVLLSLGRALWNDIEVGFFLNYTLFIILVFYSAKLVNFLFGHIGRLEIIVLAIFMIFSPISVILLQGIQSDLTAAAFSTIFSYHILRCQPIYTMQPMSGERQRISILHLISASIFGIFAILTRPNTMTLILPLPFLMLFISKSVRRQAIIINGVVFLICLMAVIGWSARNFRLTGQFTPSLHSIAILYTVYVSNNVDSEETVYSMWQNDRTRREYIRDAIEEGKTPLQAQGLLASKLKSVTLSYIWSHPVHFAQRLLFSYVNVFVGSYYRLSFVTASRLTGLKLGDNNRLDFNKLSHDYPLLSRITVGIQLIDLMLHHFLMLLVFLFTLPILFLCKNKDIGRSVAYCTQKFQPDCAENRLWRHYIIVLFIASSLFIIVSGAGNVMEARLRFPILPFFSIFLLCLIPFLCDFWNRLQFKIIKWLNE
ncbi:MAG: hypothetical protein AABZ11_08150 [Nitrospinota bacterium]